MKAHVEVVLDCARPAELAAFWRAALGYRQLYGDEALVVLVPTQHAAPPLLLQRVDAELQTFGGTEWVRMADPEDNELCVSSGVEW